MNTDAPSHTAKFYRDNPFVLKVYKGCQVPKAEIARVIGWAKYLHALQTLVDSHPDLAQELPNALSPEAKTRRWVPLQEAEIIVLKWIDHPEAHVRFEHQATFVGRPSKK